MYLFGVKRWDQILVRLRPRQQCEKGVGVETRGSVYYGLRGIVILIVGAGLELKVESWIWS